MCGVFAGEAGQIAAHQPNVCQRHSSVSFFKARRASKRRSFIFPPYLSEIIHAAYKSTSNTYRTVLSTS